MDWRNLVDMERVQCDALLADIPVINVWGIGTKVIAHLQDIGIHTALQLRYIDQGTIRKKFGMAVRFAIQSEMVQYTTELHLTFQ